jgi:hypothetical protein
MRYDRAGARASGMKPLGAGSVLGVRSSASPAKEAGRVDQVIKRCRTESQIYSPSSTWSILISERKGRTNMLFARTKYPDGRDSRLIHIV